MTKKIGDDANQSMLDFGPDQLFLGHFKRLGLTAIIPATDGSKIIPGSDAFSHYIADDFVRFGLNGIDEPRPKTRVESLELAVNCDAERFFLAFGRLDQSVMTNDQIIWVVKENPDLLTTETSDHFNFFLKKKGEEFFLVFVAFKRRMGFRIGVFQINRRICWYVHDRRPRIIRPM